MPAALGPLSQLLFPFLKLQSWTDFKQRLQPEKLYSLIRLFNDARNNGFAEMHAFTCLLSSQTLRHNLLDSLPSDCDSCEPEASSQASLATGASAGCSQMTLAFPHFRNEVA